MPTEVFSWPEGSIYLYPSGSTSALVAYADSIDFTKTWDIQTIKLMGGTGSTYTRYVTKGIDVRVSIGQLYHTMSMWSMAQSGTGLALEIKHYNSVNGSAGFVAWGVRFPEWSLKESEGQCAKSSVQIIAADVSAYGSGI